MPDRREILLDISTALHVQVEALRRLNDPVDRGVSIAIIRLCDAVDYVEHVAGLRGAESRAAA